MVELAQQKYLSVSQVLGVLGLSLERNFPAINFEGEISSVTKHANGHLYLAIKDQSSKLEAVAWRSFAQTIKFEPRIGMQVLCQGRPKIWSGAGKLQIELSRIEPSGEGLLQKKFLELKAKLEKEGFFNPERKRKIPFFPRAVGVVTSQTGAVIHDIMVKIKERMASQIVYLVNARVQGEGAAAEIAEGVKRLSDSGLVDVIIVARGGGSLEDLWAFNEELVVKAIFASKVPVVSGVGHEVDLTLADLAADQRAPTPTAAAEMVVPRRSDLLLSIAEYERRLRDYERWFRGLEQGLDELVMRLQSRLKLKLEETRSQLASAENRLRRIQPDQLLLMLQSKLAMLKHQLELELHNKVQLARQKLENLSLNLSRSYLNYQRAKKSSLESTLGKMAALDPRKVLERGFSLVEFSGRLISSAHQLKEGDLIGLRFSKGSAKASVSEIIK